MAENYKLKEEIKKFIIIEKKRDPKLSCRGLSILIRERFKVDLSKSLINNVIKENNLSSPVGRRSARVLKPEVIKQGPEIMQNGGFFFLKAADIRLGLTFHLAEGLSGLIQAPQNDRGQIMIEWLIYSSFFKDKKSLSLLIGSEVPEENISHYSQQLASIPLAAVKSLAAELGVSHNISEINDLHNNCLLRLNSFIAHYFPQEYQFLDLSTMLDKFYSLPAKLERKSGLLVVQLLYPEGFRWLNDINWQESLSHAANKVNETRIFTPEKEQIWVNPQAQFLQGNVFSNPLISS